MRRRKRGKKPPGGKEKAKEKKNSNGGEEPVLRTEKPFEEPQGVEQTLRRTHPEVKERFRHTNQIGKRTPPIFNTGRGEVMGKLISGRKNRKEKARRW